MYAENNCGFINIVITSYSVAIDWGDAWQEI